MNIPTGSGLSSLSWNAGIFRLCVWMRLAIFSIRQIDTIEKPTASFSTE